MKTFPPATSSRSNLPGPANYDLALAALLHETPMKTPPPTHLPVRAARPTTRLALVSLAAVLALHLSDALAQPSFNPPELMTYQGFLVDGNGVALGNTAPKNYDVIFRIYNHESASDPANLRWSEQQTLTVDKGYFSVLLGEGAQVGSEPRPPLSTLFKDATASDRYVGITVKGIGPGGSNVDILPRLRLMSAPYAFLSQQAVKLVRDTGADLISASGNAVTVSGSLAADTLAGNGANLTALNAGALASGTLADARLSANVALRSGGNTFSGNQVVNDRLGLGVAGPGARLHAGDSANVVGILESSSAIGTWLAVDNTSAGGLAWQLISSGSGNGEGAGKLLVGHGANPGGVTVRMTLDSAGNLGIGNSSPERRLEVAGPVGIEGGNFLEFGRGYTKEVNAGKIGYGTFSGGPGGSLDIVGAGTGSNRKITMWAESGLNLNGYMANGLDVHTGFGKTFDVVNNVMRVFHYNDKGKFFQMYRYDQGVALYGGGGGWGNASGDVRQITWDGDSNWDTSSDRRLKKDIVDAEPMLDRALKVQVRRFRWKDDPDDAKHVLGVVAQELQPLFPDLIAEQVNPANDEKTLAVGYSDFGMIALKALQELKVLQDAELLELRHRTAAQEAQLTAQARELSELRTRMSSIEQLLRETAAAAKTGGAVPASLVAQTDDLDGR